MLTAVDDTDVKGESGQYHCPREPKTAPSWSTLKGKAAGPMDHPRMGKACHTRHRQWLAGATSCKVPGTHGPSDGKSPAAKASPTHPSSPRHRQLVNLINADQLHPVGGITAAGCCSAGVCDTGHFGEGKGRKRGEKAKQPTSTFPLSCSVCET